MDAIQALRFNEGSMEGSDFSCRCGRHHVNSTVRSIAGAGVLSEVPGAAQAVRGDSSACCLVADSTTFAVAGSKVSELLRTLGLEVTVSLLDATPSPDDPPLAVHADETGVGALMLDVKRDTGFLVAVGSGSVTDVTRFVASRIGVPFISVATAPSVDAYTSTTSPMTRTGFKDSRWGTQAKYLIADTRVLAEAPRDMIASGLGDTVAKLVARFDWKLADLTSDAYYCADIEAAVTESALSASRLSEAIGRAEEPAILALMESLTVSGAAMAMADDTRPASGAEHSISHYLEMRAMQNHEPALFHGTKVGVATVVMSVFWDRFRDRLVNTDPASIDPGRLWAERRTAAEIGEFMLRAFGQSADSLFSDITSARLDEEKTRNRIEVMKNRWTDLIDLASEVPETGDLVSWLRAAGGPAYPADLGIGSDELRDTLFGAGEVRNRITVLSAAEDLGWLGEIIDEVVETVS